MPVSNRIAALAPEMVEWRRDLHANPELGFEERRTADFVAAKLAEWGIEVTRGIARTGVVGTLRAGSGGRAIGLRADMDALPMEEANDFAHRSRNKGAMHACGHDGHTTMLLGAARYLAETRNFDGTVHFIFQPAEEGLGGGRVMVEEGLFDRFPCERVYGAHNDPTLEFGRIAAGPGIVCANSDRFWITISGKGGHAALPHRTIDPVVVGAHVVLALQSVVARRVDPLDSAVVSVTQFHAGSTGNVIPPEAVLNGTVRTLTVETQAAVRELMDRLAQSTAAAHGAEAKLDYRPGYPTLFNDADAAARSQRAVAAVLGPEGVVPDWPPTMGGEDFSYMARQRPACFVMIGQRQGDAGAVPVHHPRYDFNDAILPVGASYWAALVEQELARG